jgi:hypothetical protein
MCADASLAMPSGQEAAAIIREVIQRWHDVRPALDWDTTVTLLPDGRASTTALIADLALINCFQWHLEDACRVVYGEPAMLAPIKLEIDRSNGRRVRCGDDIDRRIAVEIDALTSRARPALRPNRACPAQTSVRSGVSPGAQAVPRHNVGPPVARHARQKVNDLGQGIDELLLDLVTGVARLKLYPTVKLYAAGS